MKAVTFNPTENTFAVRDLPFPKLGSNDVLVKVKACGLTPYDAKISLWKHMVPGMTDSWVPGLDVSGEVVEIGKKVTRWKPGDRVLYHGYMLRPHGGFAEYAVQNEEAILHNPILPHDIAYCVFISFYRKPTSVIIGIVRSRCTLCISIFNSLKFS